MQLASKLENKAFLEGTGTHGSLVQKHHQIWIPPAWSKQEKEQQDEDFARFQAKAERRADNADSVMSNYWRADEDLDEDERFLRDYVMNRQWLETDSL